jgi:hypothetical protein
MFAGAPIDPHFAGTTGDEPFNQRCFAGARFTSNRNDSPATFGRLQKRRLQTL